MRTTVIHGRGQSQVTDLSPVSRIGEIATPNSQRILFEHTFKASPEAEKKSPVAIERSE